MHLLILTRVVCSARPPFPNEKFPRFTPVWSEIKPKPTADYSLFPSLSLPPRSLFVVVKINLKKRTKKNLSMEKLRFLRRSMKHRFEASIIYFEETGEEKDEQIGMK